MPKYTIPLRYLCLTFWRYAYVVCRYVCWHISSKRWTLQFLADQPPKLWTAGTDDGSPLKKQFDINCIESKNLLCAKSGNPSPPPCALQSASLKLHFVGKDFLESDANVSSVPKKYHAEGASAVAGCIQNLKMHSLFFLSQIEYLGCAKHAWKKNVYKYKVASFNCQKTHRDSGNQKGSDGSAIPLVQKTVKPRIWPEQVSVRAIHSQKYKKSLRNLNHFGST